MSVITPLFRKRCVKKRMHVSPHLRNHRAVAMWEHETTSRLMRTSVIFKSEANSMIEKLV